MAPGPGSNILSERFSSGSISRNCRVSSCIWTMTRPPSPMVITDGSAVRPSARISARAPPVSGIGNGAVPRRSAVPLERPPRSRCRRRAAGRRSAPRPPASVSPCGRRSCCRLVDHPQQHRVVGDGRAVLVESAHLERLRRQVRRRHRRRGRRAQREVLRAAPRRRRPRPRRPASASPAGGGRAGDQHRAQAAGRRQRERLGLQRLAVDGDLGVELVAGDHPLEAWRARRRRSSRCAGADRRRRS